MIGCLRTRFRKQTIVELYFEFENELKVYILEDWDPSFYSMDHPNFIVSSQKAEAISTQRVNDATELTLSVAIMRGSRGVQEVRTPLKDDDPLIVVFGPSLLN